MFCYLVNPIRAYEIFDTLMETRFSISVLKELAKKNFEAAILQTSFIEFNEAQNHIQKQDVLGELSSKLNSFPNSYFSNPDVIIIDEEESKVFDKLIPLIHFMEAKEILENLYEYRNNISIKRDKLTDLNNPLMRDISLRKKNFSSFTRRKVLSIFTASGASKILSSLWNR